MAQLRQKQHDYYSKKDLMWHYQKGHLRVRGPGRKATLNIYIYH